MAHKIVSFAKYCGAAIVGGIIAYLGQLYAAVDADKAQNHSRQIDIQQIPQLSWGSRSPVPNVRFTYLNTLTNTKIDQIAGTDVVLYNYSDRDAPEMQVAITATNADGSLPVFVGGRALAGGMEDYPLEENIKPVTHDHALAFSFKVPSLNRQDGGNASRSFQLYFAGKVAPLLAVSASAPGFESRPWEPAHIWESQLAKLPLAQRYASTLGFTALVVGALIALAAQAVFLRDRERKRMVALTNVVDNCLRQNVSTKDFPDDVRRSLASDVAFSSWCSLYDSMWHPEQWFSSKPERVS